MAQAAKISYRFFGALGFDTVDTTAGDLMALRIARIMGGRMDLKIISRWNGERWVQLHVTQMLYGASVKENLRGVYGSAAKAAFKKAQKEFEGV